MPPGWDERYLTCFGYTLRQDRPRRRQLADDQAALRRHARRDAARPAAVSLRPHPAGALPARARARPGRRDRRARGPSKRDPETRRAAVRHGPPPGQPQPRAAPPHRLPVGVHRPRRPHLASHRRERLDAPSPQGAAPSADVRLRVAWQDFVDIVGDRLNPMRAIATGRMRPRGNPLAAQAAHQGLPARLRRHADLRLFGAELPFRAGRGARRTARRGPGAAAPPAGTAPDGAPPPVESPLAEAAPYAGWREAACALACAGGVTEPAEAASPTSCSGPNSRWACSAEARRAAAAPRRSRDARGGPRGRSTREGVSQRSRARHQLGGAGDVDTRPPTLSDGHAHCVPPRDAAPP